MIVNFVRQFALFLVMLVALAACSPQATVVQPTLPIPKTDIPTSGPTPSLAATFTPAPTSTATATPCLGLAAPVSTPRPWSYADDYWNKIAIARIPIQGMECAALEEIVRQLMVEWLETIKVNSPTEDCGLEEYRLGEITIRATNISNYDIVASASYHVKPGRFAGCGWLSGRGVLEENGWIGTGDPVGVYRENEYFRLRLLPGWGT